MHPASKRPFTRFEARSLIQRFDVNGDGMLDIDEFVRAFGAIAVNLQTPAAVAAGVASSLSSRCIPP